MQIIEDRDIQKAQFTKSVEIKLIKFRYTSKCDDTIFPVGQICSFLFLTVWQIRWRQRLEIERVILVWDNEMCFAAPLSLKSVDL